MDISARGMAPSLRHAFRQALHTLPVVPDLVLIDGSNGVENWAGAQLHQPKADIHWWPVSAASILAKVERDGWMDSMDLKYPGYFWNANAGYGTPGHWAAIRHMGITPVHRTSFVRSGLSKPVPETTEE